MLSYPIDEAEELLASKLGTAKQNLENCEEDLDFLREQITVGAWILVIQDHTDRKSDYGGKYSESLQLGCYDEAKREGRARNIRRRW